MFPKSASVEQLKIITEYIAAERDQRLHGGQPVQPRAQVAATSAPQSLAPAAPAAAAPAPTAPSQPISPAPSQPSSLVMMFLKSLNSGGCDCIYL